MTPTREEAVDIFLARLRKHLLAGDDVVIEEEALCRELNHFGRKYTEPSGEVRYTVTIKPKE